jgi:hypothetical protein
LLTNQVAWGYHQGLDHYKPASVFLLKIKKNHKSHHALLWKIDPLQSIAKASSVRFSFFFVEGRRDFKPALEKRFECGQLPSIFSVELYPPPLSSASESFQSLFVFIIKSSDSPPFFFLCCFSFW